MRLGREWRGGSQNIELPLLNVSSCNANPKPGYQLTIIAVPQYAAYLRQGVRGAQLCALCAAVVRISFAIFDWYIVQTGSITYWSVSCYSREVSFLFGTDYRRTVASTT